MMKIKVKDSPEYLKSIIKGKDITILECIFLLDTAINMLRDDFGLSNEEIRDLLKEYKDNLEEKSND